MTGPFYRNSQLALMAGTGTSHPTGNNFRPLGQNFPAVFANGLVVDVLYLIRTESANFSSGLSVSAISIHNPFVLLPNSLKRQIAVIGVRFIKTPEITHRQAVSSLGLLKAGRLRGKRNIVPVAGLTARAGIRKIRLIHDYFVSRSFLAGLILVAAALKLPLYGNHPTF